MDQHAMLQALKDLALEMDNTPTKAQFCARIKGADYHLPRLFGTYTQLLQAAGLETYDERRSGAKPRRIDKSVFQKNLESHLESYEPRPVIDRGPFPTLASVSDIHFPFANERVLARFFEYVGDSKPKTVALNGDAWDFYSHSKYPRSHNIFTPREEEQLARQMNEEFWQEIKRRSPESRCVQMMGNHDVRPLKRILETYPSAEDWVKRELERLFCFNGVETIFDPRQELYLREDIILFHGYRSKLGDHRDYTLMNCINGHTHSGGVVFRRIRGETLWELNSGVAGDPESKGLSYTPQKIVHWTPGFGAIDKNGPRFIPV